MIATLAIEAMRESLGGQRFSGRTFSVDESEAAEDMLS
jgi:hypothetical protein